MASQFSLDDIAQRAVAVLDFAEAQGGAMPASEVRVFRFVLFAFELTRAKYALKRLPKKQRAYYDKLREKLRVLLYPPEPALGLAEYLRAVCPTLAVRSVLRKHMLEQIQRWRKPHAGRNGKMHPGISGSAALARTIASIGRPVKDQLLLAQLAGRTQACIDLWQALGRQPLPSEARKCAGILRAWDTPGIKAELLSKTEEELDHFDGLLSELHGLLDPAADARPIRPLHLQPEVGGAVAKLNAGNFSLNHERYAGLGMRPLSAGDVNERIALLAQRCDEIGVLAHELSLVRNSDRPAAARIKKLAMFVAKRGRIFAQRCKDNPLAIYAVSVVNQENGQREFVDSKGARHATVNGTPMTFTDARRIAEKAGGEVIDTSRKTIEEILDDAERLKELFAAEDS